VSNASASNSVLEREFKIQNQYGIHARPAALFVKIASRYNGDVQVEKDGTTVSGKSIMGLMTLQASCGSRLRVTVSGHDGEQMLDELENLIERKFDED